MPNIYNGRTGQSTIDLSMQLYGNADNIVKICLDNDIDDVNLPISSGQVLTYENNAITAITKKTYATIYQINGRVFDASVFDDTFE